MGSFANSMFSALLGWVRTAFGWLWNVFFGMDGGGLVTWIGEHWLGLTIALCVICMAVDGIIHLVRWQPYKVWVSFFRRLTGKEEPQHTDGYSGRLRREWHYADGTARTEEVAVPAEELYPEEAPPARVSSADMPPQYVQAFAKPENLRYQEELSKEQPQGLEDYPQPPPAAEEQEIQEAPRPRQRKRMMRLNALAPDDELELRYRPAPPPVDKRDAYQEPYIPPQWKRPRRRRAANKEEGFDHADR